MLPMSALCAHSHDCALASSSGWSVTFGLFLCHWFSAVVEAQQLYEIKAT